MLYKKLDIERFEIRVLALLPGTWSEPIRCELSIVRLDEKPPYHALSYVWGEPISNREIFINQAPVAVTENLFRALRRIRKSDAVRTLWVDALCINQKDVQERNQQVSIMGHIYGSAKAVLIWLGDCKSPTSKPPLVWYDNSRDRSKLWPFQRSWSRSDDFLNELLRSVSYEMTDVYLVFIFLQLAASDHHPYDTRVSLDSDHRNETLQSLGLWSQAIHGLHYLTRLPWWKRVWVLQEAVLPSRAIVLFGNLVLPWTIVAQASSNIAHHLTSCCSGDSSDRSVGEEVLKDFMAAVGQIEQLRIDRARGTKISLSQLLSLTLDRCATDGRDKIYGLLSLVTEWYGEKAILPHYASSIAQVYAEATVVEIRGGHSLQALQGVPMDAVDGLPSWVKKISSPIMADLQRARVNMSSLFNASGCRPSDVEALKNSVLGVLGHSYCDIVSRVSPHVWGETSEGCAATALAATHKAWRALANSELAPHLLYPSGGSWKDEFWRVITSDATDGSLVTPGSKRKHDADEAYDMSWQRLTAAHKAFYRAWWLHVEAATSSGETSSTSLPNQSPRIPETSRIAYNRAVQATMFQRRFFVTEKGYMGTGPLDTSPGDRITILFGGDVPFLLRKAAEPSPVNNMSKRQSPRWQLIGDCYVHGIMDGEMMNNNEKKQMRYFLR